MEPVNDETPATKDEGSGKTKTQTISSVAAGKDFERLPRAIGIALSRGDLSFNEHGVLCFIVGTLDYRMDEFVTTIGSLADSLQWEPSDDWLSRILGRLRKERWLDYTVRRGPRAPYSITHGPRLLQALQHGTTAAFRNVDFTTGELLEPETHSETDYETNSEWNGNEPSPNASNQAPSEGLGDSALAYARKDEDEDEDKTETQTRQDKLNVEGESLVGREGREYQGYRPSQKSSR